MLASAGSNAVVRIYDRRESKVVISFDKVHWGKSYSNIYVLDTCKLIFDTLVQPINCVRWSAAGDLLTTASEDTSSKVVDIKTGRAIHSGVTLDGSKFGYIFSI